MGSTACRNRRRGLAAALVALAWAWGGAATPAVGQDGGLSVAGPDFAHDAPLPRRPRRNASVLLSQTPAGPDAEAPDAPPSLPAPPEPVADVAAAREDVFPFEVPAVPAPAFVDGAPRPSTPARMVPVRDPVAARNEGLAAFVFDPAPSAQPPAVAVSAVADGTAGPAAQPSAVAAAAVPAAPPAVAVVETASTPPTLAAAQFRPAGDGDPDAAFVEPNPLSPIITAEEVQANAEARRLRLSRKWELVCQYEKAGLLDDAVAAAEEIQFEDPGNVPVREKLLALQRRRDGDKRGAADALRARRLVEVREWIDVLNQPTLPREYVARPDLTGRLAAAYGPADPRATESIRALLGQRVSYNFVEDDLAFVVNHLANENDLNIMYDPSFLRGKQVTLRFNGTTLESVIDSLTAQHDLDFAYTPDNRALVLFQAGDDDASIKAARRHMTTEVIRLMNPPISYGEPVQLDGGGGLQEGGQQGGGQQGGQGGEEEETRNSVLDQLAWMEETRFGGWPAGTSYRYDANFSTVTVTSTPRALRAIRRYIEENDLPPVQVMVTVQFITVNQNKLHAIGIDWTASKIGDNYIQDYQRDPRWEQDIANGVTDSDYEGVWIPLSEAAGGVVRQGVRGIEMLLGTAGDGAAQMHYTAKLFDRLAVDATIHAIESKGDGMVLAAPMTFAFSGQRTYLDLTYKYPYIEDYEVDANQATTDTTVGGGQAIVTPVWNDDTDVGTQLAIRPTVGNDMKSMILEVRPMIRSVRGTYPYEVQYFSSGRIQTAVAERPIFQTNTLAVRAALEDGQTIVIGGLVDDQVSESVKKIPGLWRIPVIGKWLFQNKRTSRENQTLLIFVTANIVTNTNKKYDPKPPPSARDRFLRESMQIQRFPDVNRRVPPSTLP